MCKVAGEELESTKKVGGGGPRAVYLSSVPHARTTPRTQELSTERAELDSTRRRLYAVQDKEVGRRGWRRRVRALTAAAGAVCARRTS